MRLKGRYIKITNEFGMLIKCVKVLEYKYNDKDGRYYRINAIIYRSKYDVYEEGSKQDIYLFINNPPDWEFLTEREFQMELLCR